MSESGDLGRSTEEKIGRIAERVEALCDRSERIERLCENTDDRLRKLEERAAREDGQNYDARLAALSQKQRETERKLLGFERKTVQSIHALQLAPKKEQNKMTRREMTKAVGIPAGIGSALIAIWELLKHVIAGVANG
jgi:hypothetical protein